jgi:hypothetical protein
MKVLLMSILVLGISACASVGGISNPFAKQVQPIVAADVTAALAEATAANDTAAVACYTAISNYMASLPSGGTATINGALSGLEAARILNSQVSAGIPSNIHQACAVIVLDAQETALRLGLTGAALGKPIAVPVLPIKP